MSVSSGATLLHAVSRQKGLRLGLEAAGLTRDDVYAAYVEAAELLSEAAAGAVAAEPAEDGNRAAFLRKRFRPQADKAQLQFAVAEVPALAQLLAASSDATTEGGAIPHKQQAQGAFTLPPALERVAVHLTRAAVEYAHSTIGAAVPSAVQAGALDKLGLKSVFRVWRYDSEVVPAEDNFGAAAGSVREAEEDDTRQCGGGGGCRGHFDPGLCTALLSGSAPGLEVAPAVEVVVADNNAGAAMSTAVKTTNSGAMVTSSMESSMQNFDEAAAAFDATCEWIPVARWGRRGADDGLSETGHSSTEGQFARVDAKTGAVIDPRHEQCVILMTDTTTQALTAGALKHLFHRVVPVSLPVASETVPACAAKLHHRINIVLELRPAKNKWFAFAPTEPERATLADILRTGNV